MPAMPAKPAQKAADEEAALERRPSASAVFSDEDIALVDHTEPTSALGVQDDVEAPPPIEFATGDAHPAQCLCCWLAPPQDRRLSRIVPCFMNVPLPCCRKGRAGDDPWCLACGLLWCFRVGNFTVLAARREGPAQRLFLVVGPYWPFCVSVTAAPAALVPAALMVLFWRNVHCGVMITLLCVTLFTLVALFFVACRDPGILLRHDAEPASSKAVQNKKKNQAKWVWNDQAKSWRPQLAGYDRDVNAIVTRFDHVCPFTGTAIGARNLRAFHVFVFAIQVLIYYSVIVGIWVLWNVASRGYTSTF